ncbi:hypothetical protein D7D25_00265 [Proteiniphilum sp. X52]|jgi:hypothetical protein|nr:hypothetical protein D7D25_00265 [Proteiniphilum sp. X52]
MMNRQLIIGFLVVCIPVFCYSQPPGNRMDIYNPVWTSQSAGSHESMPCGGGDIGLNVWVEKDDVLFYISRSGSFDENNTLLKSGRVRLRLTPNPFRDNDFSQTLNLSDGKVIIRGGTTAIEVWVDVHNPIIHVEVNSKEKVETEVFYENWRYKDRLVRKGEGNQNSYKWALPEKLFTKSDIIEVEKEAVCFYHRNSSPTIFDVTVSQQGLDSVKNRFFNPLENLISGGKLWGDNLKYSHTGYGTYMDTDYQFWSLKSKKPASGHRICVALHTAQEEGIDDWKKALDRISRQADVLSAKQTAQKWWQDYWERSYIIIDKDRKGSEAWKTGRNYQLFRYMLGCNAYGAYPTKFNGGLFTFDPVFVDSTQAFTPDYRKWGGGTFTAQNQRLVYFPMLKSGDFDMMGAQFDFYLRILRNAEIRSQSYWGHDGACFTEQMENFGLPNPSEYGWKRPDYFDKGIEYNAWLEYQWDTVLEFCLMILETNAYNNSDITRYIPFIESCLTFFDEHYTRLAKRRGAKSLDENGHLVLYPGTACETYKMAYNATPTVAALTVVLERLVALDNHPVDKEKWEGMLSRIPPITTRVMDGRELIAPARLWERVNNVESPQLYPVFPWRLYGIGKKDIHLAINTYLYDPDMLKFRSHVGWKQDNIFAACLGLTDEAKRLTLLKMADGPFRFPAFWGPGFDWTPDHNWGGSGMIGLQEMLVQTVDDKIYLFPAWPKEWNVHFKLHLSGNTIVEAELVNGKLGKLNVSPSHRLKDVINMIGDR